MLIRLSALCSERPRLGSGHNGTTAEEDAAPPAQPAKLESVEHHEEDAAPPAKPAKLESAEHHEDKPKGKKEETSKEQKTEPSAQPKLPTAAESDKVKDKDLFVWLEAALPKGFHQLLPSKLVWAPTCQQLARELPGNVALFLLSDTKDDPYLKGGTFSITHYPPSALGTAFGPPSLCQLMRFCQLLEAKLGERDDSCVILGTPKNDDRARTTAAILVGGYLVVQQSWTATAVARALAEEAKFKFSCPWSSAGSEPNSMTVADCWHGLEMAAKQGWISKSDVMDENACRNYMDTSEIYDASWLVPGHVIVSADPMSTVMDPNPKTVAALGSTPKGWVGLEGDHAGEQQDFLSWCKAVNVGLVVRSNFGTESGLKQIGGSYDKEAFTSVGISQLDVAVADVKGGIPDARSISTMVNCCKESTDDRRCAVLIHCKAGFGRSVMYAACWIIQKFDVPGQALMGWMRMARPGAITTPQQEIFLQRLKGRKEVEKLASRKSGMFGKLFK